MDDLDFGGLDKKKGSNKEPQKPVVGATNNKKKNDEDNGLFVDANDFGDDFDNEYDDDFLSDENNKDKDIFEDSRSKAEKQKKEQEKKDESANKAGESTAKKAVAGEEDEELEPEEQAKMIIDQFNLIYENDPELRQLLGGDISGLSLEEKYQILTAYMNGDGVRGLMEDPEKSDDEKLIEDEFNAIYEADPKLRELLAGADPSNLNIKEKYQIVVAYKKGGGV